MSRAGAAVSRHRDVVAGPAQRGVEVRGHVGGAAGAAGVAARGRAASAPAGHRGGRARLPPRAAPHRAPRTLRAHHLQRQPALTLRALTSCLRAFCRTLYPIHPFKLYYLI